MTQINADLFALECDLIEAVGLVRLIKKEHEANGSDSLANIDYGAALNTAMLKAREAFDRLDESGMFTAGWQPDDWVLVDTSVESDADINRDGVA